MEFDWAIWGTPLMVFGGALAAGLIGMVAMRTQEDSEVSKAGKKADLDGNRTAAIQALKELELDKDKLAPADYERERAALVTRGGAAGRELDGKSAPTETNTDSAPHADVPEEVSTLATMLEGERKRLGEDSVKRAIELAGLAAPPAAPKRDDVMAPEWKGALSAVAVMSLAGLLIFLANSDEVTRREGASMTGNQDLGSPAMEPSGNPTGNPPWKAMAAQLEEKLKADPKDIATANELTQLYMSAGDPGKAMEFNRTAFEIDKTDTTARTYKAVLAAMVGMNDRAIAGLEEVLSEDPGHVKALTYLGLILLEAGRPKEAVEVLEKAVAEQPGVVPLQQALSRARQQAGMAPAPAAAPAPSSSGDIVLGGTIYLDGDAAKGITGREIMFVSVKSLQGGPPLAALRLTPGPFPMDFKVTTSDAIAMGGAPRPFPETMLLSVRIDKDGDPISKEPGEPKANVLDAVKGTTDLKLTLK